MAAIAASSDRACICIEMHPETDITAMVTVRGRANAGFGLIKRRNLSTLLHRLAKNRLDRLQDLSVPCPAALGNLVTLNVPVTVKGTPLQVIEFPLMVPEIVLPEMVP